MRPGQTTYAHLLMLVDHALLGTAGEHRLVAGQRGHVVVCACTHTRELMWTCEWSSADTWGRGERDGRRKDQIVDPVERQGAVDASPVPRRFTVGCEQAPRELRR